MAYFTDRDAPAITKYLACIAKALKRLGDCPNGRTVSEVFSHTIRGASGCRAFQSSTSTASFACDRRNTSRPNSKL